ncbi:MAG TPA: chitobiase/beta-hexosaminidase C-terminal domain-containing protein [Opitutaceae bacterium]|nr:chitobiase/beta-hexosaminidase C-terminal domain-containing protein [Opitutaceae bacterium]
MKMKLPVYAACLALFALGRVTAAPTDGLVQYSDTFTVQKPYDLNISDRFTASDVNGVLQYNCQIHSGDHALYITSTTQPRTEMRWNTNWNGGERMWEADVLVDSGTDNQTCIMQVKSNNGGNEAIYLTVNGGNLYDSYGSSPIASNIIGKWMHIICAYNPSTGLARVWINGNQVESTTRSRPAGSIFYFKNGTYHVATLSKDHFQNVKFWAHDQTGIVQSPSFAPLDATYANAQMITIYSPTPGATIRYTTDGSTPSTTSGTLYTGPFLLTKAATVTAIAYKSGMTNSIVNSSVYNFQSTTPQVADPLASLPTGIYSGPQTVAIASATPDVTIRYTTDGSIPTTTTGTLYSGPVTIGPGDTTLQAIAFKSGQVNSRVSYAFYIINGTPAVADPTFNPPAGTYTSAQNVAITSPTTGASIRYTTDGSAPSETVGTIYSSPVPVSSSQTLTAIAYKSGSADSNIVSAAYTINPLPQAAAPVFSPGGGSYTTAQDVTITSATGGASIRYTTDGSTPSETAGTLYSGPVHLSANVTLKAIAYASGFVDSTVTSAGYTFTPPPTFNFEAESLSPTGSGATVSTTNDTNASGGVLEFLNATGPGQSITFTTPSIPAGTYQFQFRYKTNTTRGQHNVKIDGTLIGGVIDQYATTQAYKTVTQGNVTFATAGTHSITLTVTGKNSASTKYTICADKFTFVGQ